MEPRSLPEKRHKQEIRSLALERRGQQPDKEQTSRRILDVLAAMREYVAAQTVAFYVGFGDEVRTRPLIEDAIEAGKTVVCPFCDADSLRLFCVRSMDDLSSGTWGILEPRPEVRALADRQIEVASVDLVVVPGVAFDRRGGRVGYGRGYYDKLLAETRRQTLAVAIAFECQMFPEVPMSPHDVFVDVVITESSVFRRGC